MIIVVIEGRKIDTMLLSKDFHEEEEEETNRIGIQEGQEHFQFPSVFIFSLETTRHKRSIFNHQDFPYTCSILPRGRA